MAQPNSIQQASPTLNTKEITDSYVKDNFRNLNDYFAKQNQLKDFRFFDLTFTEAQSGFLLSHGFSYVPQDILITKLTGGGTVVFNYGLFTTTNINITVTGACRVRFFVGTYWNFITTVNDPPTIYTAHNALPSAAATTVAAQNAISDPFINPMTTAGDMIYGLTAGLPARLPGGALGTVLTSSGPTSAPSWTAVSSATTTTVTSNYNFLVNGAFDYWQVGTNASVTATGAGTPTATYLYQADQWYVNNILGGGTVEGIIKFQRFTGVLSGSKYYAGVLVTTAPTGTGIGAGPELYQTLSNAASLSLYNKTASFSAQIQSTLNVTQVGLQFFYATTEVKVTTAIGSEVLCAVNNIGYTLCSINGQALGTAMTASGVVGVRIRVTAVSSGNVYDINNGFAIEQAMLNLGSTAQSFQRQYADPAQEIAACQYFYEKSYDLTTNPATTTQVGATAGINNNTASSFNIYSTVQYKVTKRNGASVTFYSTNGGATGKYRNVTAGADGTVTAQQFGMSSFYVLLNSIAATQQWEYQWVADARI